MLSPTIHKLADEFIPSGLSAALVYEPFDEPFYSELTAEGLRVSSWIEKLEAERLGPNRVSESLVWSRENM
jgi:hypothetical protein